MHIFLMSAGVLSCFPYCSASFSLWSPERGYLQPFNFKIALFLRLTSTIAMFTPETLRVNKISIFPLVVACQSMKEKESCCIIWLFIAWNLWQSQRRLVTQHNLKIRILLWVFQNLIFLFKASSLHIFWKQGLMVYELKRIICESYGEHWGL